MKRFLIERLEVPQQHYQFAMRRMLPFVKFAGNLAQFGTVDLNNLAASAYLQGVADGAEAIERRYSDVLKLGKWRARE